MLANLKYYLIGSLVILSPLGLRILSLQQPAVHQASAEDITTGRMLFSHEWTVNDPLSPNGDGIGPVFNARSCVACHKQGGIGGGGDNKHNVTTFVLEQPSGDSKVGVVHAYATRKEYLETLQSLSNGLPRTSQPTLKMIRDNPVQRVGSGVLHLSQRNTPALFGSKLIDEIPERVILAEQRKQQIRWGQTSSNTEAFPVGRAFRLQDGRVGKFGWKAQSASLGEFVRAACANELGLGNSNNKQPIPMSFTNYRTPGIDLTQKQCDQITAFCASLPRPVERHGDFDTQANIKQGRKIFRKVGCVHCHTPDMGSIRGIYSDLLLHRMGVELVGSGVSYGNEVPELPKDRSPEDGSLPDEWRTPPLWGVADSAPYLHDGRAATLEEAIRQHGGQGTKSAQNFSDLSKAEQQQLLTFLQSLRAPTEISLAQK